MTAPAVSEQGDQVVWKLQREVREPETIVRLTHEGDPASKSRARFTNRGSKVKAYTPEKTRQAELALGWTIRAAARGLQIDGQSSFGVMAVFFTATWQRRDVDNMLKLVLDACTGLVWVDDSQVTEVSGRIVRADEHPRTELWIYQTLLQAPPTQPCRDCGKPVRQYKSVQYRYCSAICQRRHGRTLAKPKTCEQCKQEYVAKGAGQRFCTAECRRAVARAARVDCKCVRCGTDYTIPRSLNKGGLKMCSQECRASYWRDHRKAAAKGVCSTCGGPTTKKSYTNCRACQQSGKSLKIKLEESA